MKGLKTGGREKGTPNRRSLEIAEVLAQNGFDPDAPWLYWARVLKSHLTPPPKQRTDGRSGVDKAEQFFQGRVTLSDGRVFGDPQRVHDVVRTLPHVAIRWFQQPEVLRGEQPDVLARILELDQLRLEIAQLGGLEEGQGHEHDAGGRLRPGRECLRCSHRDSLTGPPRVRRSGALRCPRPCSAGSPPSG